MNDILKAARAAAFVAAAFALHAKGVGLEALYPNPLALTAFTLVIVGASVRRFRKQLSRGVDTKRPSRLSKRKRRATHCRTVQPSDSQPASRAGYF
jgi:hypothetical protein